MSDPDVLVPTPHPDALRVVGRTAYFDGMGWPLPDSDATWRAHHGDAPLTRSERYYLTAIVAAYTAMIYKPRREREKIIRQLRTAIEIRDRGAK